MRISALVSIAAVQATPAAHNQSRVRRQDNDGDDERRYSQLVDMMGHYNSDFDERKYWAYGCNCLILGDRPMSDPGYGPPVDALDSVCKEYKDCVKCARMKHGDSCIGEFVKYRYGYKNGEAVCNDKANSCKRDLCECDAMFARKHVSKTHVFDSQYHMFWSTNNGGTMWDPKSDPAGHCPRGGGAQYIPECCQPKNGDGPAVLYNSATKACCNDGRVVKDVNQC
jgi:hypothetical protein